MQGGAFAPPDDLVEIGRVTGAHGIRGWLKVAPHGNPHDSVLLQTRVWWLSAGQGSARPRAASIPAKVAVAKTQSATVSHTPSGHPAAGDVASGLAGPRQVRIAAAKAQHDSIVAQLEGVEDRNAAMAFKGARVLVPRRLFPAIGPDEYYWVDLIGCRVFDPQGGELGTVIGVEEYGADPLLNVRGPDGVDRLIPMVPQTLENIDLAARRIVAAWALDY